jgi:hypothetical protein
LELQPWDSWSFVAHHKVADFFTPVKFGWISVICPDVLINFGLTRPEVVLETEVLPWSQEKIH